MEHIATRIYTLREMTQVLATQAESLHRDIRAKAEEANAQDRHATDLFAAVTNADSAHRAFKRAVGALDEFATDIEHKRALDEPAESQRATKRIPARPFLATAAE